MFHPVDGLLHILKFIEHDRDSLYNLSYARERENKQCQAGEVSEKKFVYLGIIYIIKYKISYKFCEFFFFKNIKNIFI